MFSRKQEVNSGQVRKKLKSSAGEPTNGGEAAEEMEEEAKFQLLNFFFCLINFIFLVLGVSIAACSLWILFDPGNLLNIEPSEEIRTVGVGLLLIGSLVLLVAVIGYIGVSRNKELLLMYLGLVIVLVLGLLFITLLLLINRDKVERILNETIDQIIHQYGTNSTGQNQLMDNIQNQGQCCGRMGASDWLTNPFIQNLTVTNPDVLPCSCFKSSRLTATSPWCADNVTNPEQLIGQGHVRHQQGCEKQISDWLQQNVLTIIGMNLSLVLMQVIQIFITVHLWRVIGRRAAKGKILEDSDHKHLEPPPEEESGEALENYGYIEPDDSYADFVEVEGHHDLQSHGRPIHQAYHHDTHSYN